MKRIPLSFLTSAVFSETAATEAVDVSAFEGLIMKIVTSDEVDVSTLDIVIQDSEDGATWHTLETVSQISAAGTVMVRKTRFLRFVRCSITLGGTSFVLGITGWGLRQE